MIFFAAEESYAWVVEVSKHTMEMVLLHFAILVTFVDVDLKEVVLTLFQGEGEQGIGIFVSMVAKNSAECFHF